MKPGAWLCNVSRGAVVDEAALVAALREGRIGGAALDVFVVQPLAAGHPLRELPNTVLSPHVGGLSRESAVTMSSVAAAEVVRVLAASPRTTSSTRRPPPRIETRRAALGLHP